jgi:transcriptional regulator with XRE-family HTH domain
MHFFSLQRGSMATPQSPTVRRRRLAHELRELREQAGLTLDQAAARLEDFSAAKISRIETAKVGARPRDVEALLDVYGLYDPQRRANLITLTRESRQRGWWEQFSDAMSPLQDLHIGLEAEAVSIRIFSPYFISGLFQTKAYARALLEASFPSESLAQLKRRVELRMERQKILKDPDRLKIRAVLDETVLSRPVGGSRTLRSQLRRLTELAQFPNVSLRILPLSVGAHAGAGAFRIIDLPIPDPSVVHLEHPTGATYLEEESEVRLYSDIFKRLENVSMPPKQSLELITAQSGEKKE